MIVLDTTVLVFAVGSEHPLREPCRRLVKAVTDGSIEATTTVEVIQEFAYIRAKRRPRSDAASRAGDYLTLLSPLLMVEEGVLSSGLAVFEAHDRLGSFDSVLAAAARANGATALVSADRAFAAFTDVPHVFPDEAGVKGLIGE
ncbi:hypothetical protein HDA32_004236 [Spinactinospora alkalitolerans]|uniref:Ribonuclease VapC n=1 Tax=Spinactinospora alkalitolerans TaxID=687207 RepID=A0A852TX83_9ACTN|nr:type II toxin-antitoxin system VapC family toxin [Spinactinospora alkalitolerans]NYE49116.1 hypothetical protein [Spinactinospora alkalitolerans]